jgi:nitrate/TMAO reductase-like tetraheme cytochrome c subunit
MIDQPASIPARRPSVFQNWISLMGVVLAACAFFAVLFLIAMDLLRSAATKNPYMGILTYIVAPAFLSLGLILVFGGALWERRRRHHLAPGEVPKYLRIDFNIPHHRNMFLTVSIVTAIFLLMTAFGSYQTYHFTESVQFCGLTCHSVMEPEFTAYQSSPHARVACAQCHIGEGADWFVKSKLSGSYQVYATLANKYPRPIPTPISNLRPSRETCEQCHWPQKFFGNVERVNQHFLADEQNSPWTIRLLMKVGGGDPEHGPVGGIHWHMNIANTVEYIASDTARQVIPWVRLTDATGKTTVFQSEDKPLTEEQITAATPRRMDCIDCHNRPSHNYQAPARAVNVAMATGRISPKIPNIKKLAVEALTAEYATTGEAMQKIAEKVPAEAVAEVQKIYRQNFFPSMKVNWRVYPNNIGHTIFPGCYRCHDGKHKSADGRVISHDCNACHTILAQGRGEQLQQISAAGFEFQHPTDIADMWKEINCAECHTGALTQ